MNLLWKNKLFVPTFPNLSNAKHCLNKILFKLTEGKQKTPIQNKPPKIAGISFSLFL